MSDRFGDKQYPRYPGQARLSRDTRLAMAHFQRRPADSFQQKKYLYQIQVVTRDKRSGNEIFRMINVSERERSTLGSIEGAARDVIMESSVSAREDFVRTELVGAFFHPSAPNVD